MLKLTYFKRYRMELDLRCDLPPPRLPPDYGWIAWHDLLMDLHAEVKFLSFQNEVDAQVFPCLGDREGCRGLMQAIRQRCGFCPEATWLIRGPVGCVATVQGVVDEDHFGAIQNLGVLAEHRGQGLGKALLLKALHGFREIGVQRAFLEVTACNHQAMRLYRHIGFRCRRTIYRSILLPETICPSPPQADSLLTLGMGV